MKNHWLQKKHKGFPQDDEHSIQQGCCGNIKCSCGVNLDIFFSCQFIQNEIVKSEIAFDGNKVGHEPTEHTPVLPSTLTGTFYYDSIPVQTFYTKEDGSFVLTKIGTPVNYVERGTVIHTTGEIFAEWNNAPPSEKITLVISYEFNMEKPYEFNMESNE